MFTSTTTIILFIVLCLSPSLRYVKWRQHLQTNSEKFLKGLTSTNQGTGEDKLVPRILTNTELESYRNTLVNY